MSIFAFGDIVLSNCDIDTISLATKIADIAATEKVYMKFGGNVSNIYFRVAEEQLPCLQFELTDSIVENTAELLFALPNCELYINDDLLPNRPWNQRMDSVSKLIRQILELNFVDEVILNIGVESFVDIQGHNKVCSYSTFQSVLTELYNEDRDTYGPCGSIHILPDQKFALH